MIEKIKIRIKEKIISTFDSDYIRKSKQNPQHVFIQNINKDYQINVQKRALVSYLTLPILKDLDKNIAHTNYREFIQILHVLTKLNFQIDICHYQDPNVSSSFKDKKYDLILGLGEPFNTASKANPASIRILYCAIEHFNASWLKVKERIDYFKARHSKTPEFSFQNHYLDEHFTNSNYLIHKGNNEIKISFNHLDNINKIFSIFSSPFSHSKFILDKRNISESKENFLWFGSRDIYQKGLDILIDVFNEEKEKNLFIAGIDDDELNLFSPLPKNIKNLGFINLNSNEFLSLMNKCSFVIFPSSAEGMASGVLTCMNHGMIPIITKECGIDIDESLGFVLKKFKADYILEELRKVCSLNENDLDKLHQNVFKNTRDNYNLEKFTKKIETHICSIINNHKLQQ